MSARATALPGGILERTALKEWAVLVDAMARGDIVALVRKGGIRERRTGFSVRHDRFLFYPTFFHEREGELAPRFLEQLAVSHAKQPPDGLVRLRYVGEAVAVWHVMELEPLRAVASEHGLDWAAVTSRFHYRDTPGVQVVAVRVARLPTDVEVPEARRYRGCVSWIELDRDVDVSGATAVVAPEQFAQRLARLHAALGEPMSAPER